MTAIQVDNASTHPERPQQTRAGPVQEAELQFVGKIGGTVQQSVFRYIELDKNEVATVTSREVGIDVPTFAYCCP